MKRRFVIPAAVALTLHAILLFGFRPPRGGTKWTCPPPSVSLPPTPVNLRAPEDPPTPDDEAAVVPHGSPDLNRPDIPEPPSPNSPAVITMTPDMPHPGPIDPHATIIAGPPGDPTGTSGPDGPGAISYKRLDNPPRTTSQVAPVYPYEATRAERTGEVWVEFTVDETGHVMSPRVLRSTDRVFEEPSLRAVAKWRFEPGRKDGRAVRFRMSVPMVFSLGE